MNADEARAAVVAAIRQVAPELDSDPLPAGSTLQDDLGFDSLDQLNFVAALHDATSVDVPERDYSHLATVGSATSYLLEHALVRR